MVISVNLGRNCLFWCSCSRRDNAACHVPVNVTWITRGRLSAMKNESSGRPLQAHSATGFHFRWSPCTISGGKANHYLLGNLKKESFGEGVIVYEIWQLQQKQVCLFLSWFKSSCTWQVLQKEKLSLAPCPLNVWLHRDTHAAIPPLSPTSTHTPTPVNRPLLMSLPCWLGKPLCRACRSSLWKSPARSLLFGFCSSQWPRHRRKPGGRDFDRHAQRGSMEWFLQSHRRARSETPVKEQKEIIFYYLLHSW